MRIQITTDYAIRIVVYLAMARDVRSAQDIAEHIGISPVNVVRVVRKLLAAGVVASQRGHAGGYLLAAPSNRLTLLDVVEIMESDSARRTLGSTESECFPRSVFESIYSQADRMLASVSIDQLAKSDQVSTRGREPTLSDASVCVCG